MGFTHNESMIRSSSDLLEFEGLRQLLGRYVHSALGRAELGHVEPLTDRAAIEASLADAAEAVEYVRIAQSPQTPQRGAAICPRFDSIPDPGAAVALLKIAGAALEARQIYELQQLLEQAADIRALLTAPAERFPRIAAMAGRLADLRPLVRELRGKILPDGSVADDASVMLRQLRRDIDRQRKQVHISLERFMRSHRDEGTLQEDFVTIRNERFVVPVIAGQQRKIGGVIHGTSGTGHTLFVEPLETIDLNNELVRLREEEQREVDRILRELTERLRSHVGEIAASVDAVGRLDLLFGKARFASDFGCVIPKLSAQENRRLTLTEARHPLLEDVLRKQRKPVVPISLALDEKCRTFLISGPNTGGKTVSMKTVGLLALMAQAGLPVPATEAEFPLFEQVLADIGDNQSIAESLSTFSAHIEHIREMLDAVTPDSLVLLDELGRATDPEEGGALGVSILDRFREYGAFTLASTHLLAIKIYGATKEGVVNASMGFDDETLQPTYALRVGAPGKSAGLDIARRLGIPADMIERARAAMSTGERDIARFLAELHERLARVDGLQRQLEDERQALAARESKLQREFERREAENLKRIEDRCDAAIAAFEEQARETIGRIAEGRQQRKAAEQALRGVARARREFQETVQTQVLGNAAEPKRLPAIQEGTRVRLKGIREPARVRRKLADDRLEVQAGFMKMQISIDDIEEVLPAGQESAQLPTNISYEPGPAWNVTYREVNVIGKHAEEAMEEVDKFLDSAAMASVDRVRIVHGHGMGVLKRAVADLLARNPHVQKFYAASPAEGGNGATIAELR